MNPSRFCLTLTALVVLTPFSTRAASAELQAEYAQVRKIALKDPGVRAAYAKADAKLNAKMVEIDPSLKPVIDNNGVKRAPFMKQPVVRKPLQGAPPASPSSPTYTVAKGDTLTSIAARYRVSAADLKSANAVVDERKLRVGQKLNIPAAESPAKTKTKLF